MTKLGPYDLNEIYTGDARALARAVPDESVNCIVTSPPYYGLRDYGDAGQLGQEETPEEYIAKLVDLFRELRRGLRGDGTLWLNLGDSYASGGKKNGEGETRTLKTELFHGGQAHLNQRRVIGNCDVKPKNLLGIPWRVALALQADGWWLRSDIIWHKNNPMPESVTDRPTKSHEYIFLLTKAAEYWYDMEAIRENATDKEYREKGRQRPNGTKGVGVKGFEIRGGLDNAQPNTSRNKRSVWTVPTTPYKNAHFAVFPPKLIIPCIRAGCPPQVCVECGAPWVRVTIGFAPACQCDAATCPGIVLDPFIGSGTTAQVSIQEGRQWIGFELNPKYVYLARQRVANTQPPLPLVYHEQAEIPLGVV